MDKKRLIEICEEVSSDVENDAKEFDGKPFNGETVAIYFGRHGAAIKALSCIIKELIQDKNDSLPKRCINEKFVNAGFYCTAKNMCELCKL